MSLSHYPSASLAGLWSDHPLPDCLSELRLLARQEVDRSGIPNTRHEQWRYSNLRPISKRSFVRPPTSAFSVADLQGYRWLNIECARTFVFVDGYLTRCPTDLDDVEWIRLDRPLANEDAQRLSDAAKRFDAIDSSLFTKVADGDFGRGLMLRVRGNVEQPIRIVHVSRSSDQHTGASTRLLIELEPQASAKVLEAHVVAPQTTGEPHLENLVTDIQVGRGAHLEHARVIGGCDNIYRFAATRANVAADATLATLVANDGDRLSRLQSAVVLDGTGASVRQSGLFALGKDRHTDHHTSIIHASPHTSCHQLYKGILASNGSGTFDGTIRIKKGSHHCQAAQLNKNLMLSQEARVHAKPQLLIDNDDVRCTHGATVGQLRPEDLFYLTSRSIGVDAARRMLAHGFIREVIADARMGWCQELAECWLSDHLDGVQGL